MMSKPNDRDEARYLRDILGMMRAGADLQSSVTLDYEEVETILSAIPDPIESRLAPRSDTGGDALEIVRAIREVHIHGNSIAHSWALSEDAAAALLASQGQARCRYDMGGECAVDQDGASQGQGETDGNWSWEDEDGNHVVPPQLVKAIRLAHPQPAPGLREALDTALSLIGEIMACDAYNDLPAPLSERVEEFIAPFDTEGLDAALAESLTPKAIDVMEMFLEWIGGRGPCSGKYCSLCPHEHDEHPITLPSNKIRAALSQSEREGK
jgi:hypothetical protein